MGEEEFKKAGFEEGCLMHYFSTNEQADKRNDLELLKLQQGSKNRKIARISVMNSSGARSFPNKFARRLVNESFLCVDAKVMLFHNLKQDSNLVNGSVGYVKDIVYEKGQGPPSLPSYVIVDFGEFYDGPNFFPGEEPKKSMVTY